MARCHFIKCPQDTHASRIEIAFEPSSAPGMPAAFFGGTVFAGQEPRGERIIVDYTEFLLPADRLELGFELPAAGGAKPRTHAGYSPSSNNDLRPCLHQPWWQSSLCLACCFASASYQ